MLPVVVAPGDTLRVGVVSAVIPSTVKPYVVYSEPVAALAEATAGLVPRADVVVALTHLAFADDATVAATVDGVDLVLGGHEHENVRAYRGPRLVPVLKADANARTVYVHRVTVHRAMPRGAAGRIEVASDLVAVTDALPDDPAVAAEVARWVEAGFAGFRADGFEPGARRDGDGRRVSTGASRRSARAPPRSGNSSPRPSAWRRPRRAPRRPRSACSTAARSAWTTCCPPGRSPSTTRSACCRSAARL